jgi:hypothetical protein
MTVTPKGEKKPTAKPNPNPVTCVYFRGQLVMKDGVELPGFKEAGQALTRALLTPRLTVQPAREAAHAAD